MEQEAKVIREGYLVKKGNIFNSWKAVWVVLLEDGFEFYSKKVDGSPKGVIPLKGSSVTSPCMDYGKRMFVFKLHTTKNQDHYLQATHLEERDAWVKDIKRAIQCIEGGQKFARKSTRKSIKLPENINLGALYLSMKDPETGVKELKLQKEKKVFNHCFAGASVIDWLLSSNFVRNRREGMMLAAALVCDGYIQPAEDKAKSAAEHIAENCFIDDSDAYYYFADSGFFSEGSSSDDDEVLKEEFRGVIVKQGCLLKQGHRRKNWKVRKFVLRDDPAYLHYYDPAVDDQDQPLGSIHLRSCVVTATDSASDGKKSDVKGNLFEIITSDEVHYLIQAATREELTEWIKVIKSVASTGK
ncbi:pleckstrin isoform X1 [Stegostoma tigrinum]|uniref:pleckstrin isoform X1 n=2 Tax=Stegostoma tigrinum TaxID=3053191 RepID=UPI00202B62E0|nr:pleckstrin isoform X1 [Stegostoma tigrinum]